MTLGDDAPVMTVRATRKLLDRIGPASPDLEQATTLLGKWYATALAWRPRQIALMVSERTLLPVLPPFASASTPMARFPAHLGAVLAAHGVPSLVIQYELDQMRRWQLARASDRSRLGSLNELALTAGHARTTTPDQTYRPFDVVVHGSLQPPVPAPRQPRQGAGCPG